MSEFDFTMKADGSQPLAESHKIEGSLAAIEAHAVKVGAAIEKGFNAPALRDARGRIIATQVSAGELAAAFMRIHGPLDQLEKDMKILDTLQAQGALSAKQYADELARIGKNAGLARGNPIDAVSLGHVPGDGGGHGSGGGFGAGLVSELTDGKAATGVFTGSITGMIGPAALATGAIAALTDGIDRYNKRQQETAAATNMMLKFYDTFEDASKAVAKQRELAKDLRVELKDGVGAYSAIREASEGMYLTNQQQIDVTRNLTAALAVDGKGIESVANIMARFQYAMEAGKMEASALKQIMRESPDVMKMFEDATHKTYPQLLKMAESGQIGTEMMGEMFSGLSNATGALHKFAQQNLATASANGEIGDSMVRARNAAGDLEGGMEEAEDQSAKLAEELERTKNAALRAADALEKAKKVIADADMMSLAASNLQKIGTYLGHMADASAKVADLKTPWEKYREEVKKFKEDATASGMAADVLAQSLARMHPPEWVDYYKQMIDEIKKPEIEWNGRLHAIELAFNNGKITVDEYTEAIRRLSATYAGMDIVAAINAANGVGPRKKDTEARAFERYQNSAYEQGIGPGQGDSSDEWRDMGSPGQVGGENSWADTLNKMKDVKSWLEDAKKSLDAIGRKTGLVAEAIQTSLVGAATSLGDTLVDAANGADVSWGKFFENLLIDIEKAILKAMILKAINSAFGLGAAGDAVSAVAGGSHATGGSFTARGTGGTDSVPVLFRMSPGERADFTPQGQSSSSSGNGGNGSGPIVVQAPAVHIHDDGDRRALKVISTRRGDRAMASSFMRNRGALRGALIR